MPVENLTLTPTTIRRIRLGALAAEAQFEEAMRVARQNGVHGEPVLIAAILQAISTNYAALVTKPAG